MKRAIAVLVGFFLGGCGGGGGIPAEVVEGPSPGVVFPHQGTAPLPWIHVVPSERALAFTSVDFTTIANQIHYDISFLPHQTAMKNVRLIIVDYTTLPPENLTTTITQKFPVPTPPIYPSPPPPPPPLAKALPSPMHKTRHAAIAHHYVGPPMPPPVPAIVEIDTRRPARYYMTMSFYEFDQRPPCPATFSITSSMRKDKIPAQEAMRFMARNSIEEFHVLTKVSIPLPINRIVLNLD